MRPRGRGPSLDRGLCPEGREPVGMRVWWVGKNKETRQAAVAVSWLCAPLSALRGREKGQGSQHDITVATSENVHFPPASPAPAGNPLVHEGTPRKSGSSFRSCLATPQNDVTPWRHLECNSYFCLKTWHECAPPACAPEGEALASAEAYAPKGASPSPRPETPTRRHPSMHAQLIPHLGLGSSVNPQEQLVQ